MAPQLTMRNEFKDEGSDTFQTVKNKKRYETQD